MNKKRILRITVLCIVIVLIGLLLFIPRIAPKTDDGKIKIVSTTFPTYDISRALAYGLSANIITSNMNMIVSVKNHNKIPYVDDPSDCLYIQNESISGNHDYNYPYVKIGSHVTDEDTPGRVVFNNGHIRIHARSVEIQGETDIKLGTQFEIGE